MKEEASSRSWLLPAVHTGYLWYEEGTPFPLSQGWLRLSISRGVVQVPSTLTET